MLFYVRDEGITVRRFPYRSRKRPGKTETNVGVPAVPATGFIPLYRPRQTGTAEMALTGAPSISLRLMAR